MSILPYFWIWNTFLDKKKLKRVIFCHHLLHADSIVQATVFLSLYKTKGQTDNVIRDSCIESLAELVSDI